MWIYREEKVELPTGYTTKLFGSDILIEGRYDEDLAGRIKRLGGYWDGKARENRKLFVVPLDKAKSFTTVLKNWIKSISGTAGASNRKELERWLGFVESKVAEGYVYEKGVSKLKELGVEDHADLHNRMLVAVADARAASQKAKEAKAQKSSFGKSWIAERTGYCSKFESRIDPGQEAHYRYQGGEKFLEHVDCSAAKVQAEKLEAEAPYRIGGGSGYGYEEYHVGQVLKNSPERYPDYPEFVYVVSCTKKYFREDGLSFGVGDDQGYYFSARCRAATDEESAPVRLRISEREQKKAAEKERSAISEEIKKSGEYPDGPIFPEGGRVSDRGTIYGGGDWFVIGPEWIWYVQNNGADGDMWSRNNIRTGGAGAIGWRVPFSPELSGRIWACTAIADGEAK